MFKDYILAVLAGACMIMAPAIQAAAPDVAAPVLTAWVNETLQQNPQLQAAEAAVNVASGHYRAADRPLFNPELEIEYENSDTTIAAGGLNQAIDWADKRGARAEVADYGQIAARAELRSTRQRLAAELLQGLADWNAKQAISRVSAEQTTLMTRFARLAEQRWQAGDLNRVELELAHLAFAEAAFEQASARQDLILATRTLTVLTGSGVAGIPALASQPPVLEQEQINTERLLNELPVMQVAIAQVAAARAGVELTVREKKPDPILGFRIGKEDSTTLTGLTFSVPLFVRNTFSAEVDVANASLIRIEREAANIRREASADLVATAQVYQSARLAWNNWEASGALRLNERTELLERLWKAGELNTTDYLVQLKQALDTEVGAINQHGRMWQAWAAWLAASGLADQWLNLIPAGDQP